jgi:hypothetical protein
MELKKGIYSHYKGNLYEVFMSAQHSETEEWMVVYKALYGEKGVWVRPYDIFVEKIIIEGKEVERFAYIGNESEIS